MGEIADMMLDGTMDPETGEWNFDGEDGPGFPMTRAEAAEFSRHSDWPPQSGRHRRDADAPREAPVFRCSKQLRKRIEAFGSLQNNDAYHWQVRKNGKVIADWWPHKHKWRVAGDTACGRGDQNAFVRALNKREETDR